jgi:16S rRNA (guanine1207-N2)-methyltransferase
MRGERIHHALRSGALTLPEQGQIAVFRPRTEDDLSSLQTDRVQVITGNKVDADAFAQRGFNVQTTPEGEFAAALVCIPRAKPLARALLAQAVSAVPAGAPVYVDGQKTDGVDSMLKDLRAAGANPGESCAKAHGKLFSFAAVPLSDWQATSHVTPEGFVTLPGVFSADGPDRGSQLLAAALPAKLPRRVADLGAGWGYLSAAVLAREGVQECHLIEAEADALECARRNISDPRAQFHWADALRFKPATAFDAIVCNPPFHQIREADPALGIAFLRAAAAMLTTSGTLWLVANRHLPYERVLAQIFREHEEVGGDSAFRLYRASRPTPKR